MFLDLKHLISKCIIKCLFDHYINMKKILRNKYLILIPIIILNIISLFYLHNTPYFKRHLLYLFLSYIILFIFSKINLKIIIKLLPFLYIFIIFLLGLVLIVGREIKGAKAWLHIYGISIQPSEIAKLILVIYLSYLTIKNKNFLYLIIITLIPSILTFLEPDTGAIIFYIIILISTIKYSNLNKKYLIIMSIILLIFAGSNIALYFINKDLLINIYGTNLFYRIDRLISFAKQDNIQTINSLVSIGAHELLYIPENHNDFIFAAIISKYNPLIFILIIISFIAIFIYFLKNINKKKNIYNVFNFILLNMLLFQTFYNILMNLSLLPIIGIPLPFLSYGGSYLLTIYALIGLSINFSKYNID